MLKKFPNTKLVFSSILLKKDKKDILKKVADINSRLKNYCQQKHLGSIDKQHTGRTLRKQETSSKQVKKFSLG